MANEMIIVNMLCFGVSITEVANQLVLSDEEIVEKLNNEMDLVDKFEVMLAIAEIVERRERT